MLTFFKQFKMYFFQLVKREVCLLLAFYSLFVCLFVYLFVLFVCLFVLFVCQFVCLFVCNVCLLHNTNSKGKRVRGQKRSCDLRKEVSQTFIFGLLVLPLHKNKYQTQELERFISGTTVPSSHTSYCTTKIVTNVIKYKTDFQVCVQSWGINEPYMTLDGKSQFQ